MFRLLGVGSTRGGTVPGIRFSSDDDGFKYEVYADVLHGVVIKIEYYESSLLWAKTRSRMGFIQYDNPPPYIIYLFPALERVVETIRTNWQGVMDQMIARAMVEWGGCDAYEINQHLSKFSLVFDQFKMAQKPEIIVPQIMVDYLGVEVVEIGGDANTECDNMGVFF